MASFKFGFIGTGNMGSALVKAVCKSVNPNEIVISDANLTKAQLLSNELKCSFGDNNTVASSAKFIFLGVKPQVLHETIKSIEDTLKKREDRFVFVSMAAGTSISEIESLTEYKYPIIRIMPNTPVSVGKGVILYSPSSTVFMDDLGEFCDALKFAGYIDKIDEKLIDAASSVSGCGPAFVYLFAEALADGGVECGLPRDKALIYAANTLSGAAELLKVSGKHPGVLKDEVCSPGGTTIEGIHALEEGGFRGTVMNAVKSSYEKNSKLKK